ncbi:MAG: hypothetical protein ACK4IB_11895, partial [Erythrobacter sp.]
VLAVQVTFLDDDYVEAPVHFAQVLLSTSPAANQSTNGPYDHAEDVVVVANITDNNVAEVHVSTTEVSVIEGAAGAPVTFSLTSRPRAPVTVQLAGDDQVAPSTLQLVFDASNWQTPRVVHVSALVDDLLEGAHSGRVSVQVVTSDVAFAGATVSDIEAAVIDSNDAELVLSPM